MLIQYPFPLTVVEKQGLPTHGSSFNPYDDDQELTVNIGDGPENDIYRELIFRLDEYHVMLIGNKLNINLIIQKIIVFFFLLFHY